MHGLKCFGFARLSKEHDGFEDAIGIRIEQVFFYFGEAVRFLRREVKPERHLNVAESYPMVTALGLHRIDQLLGGEHEAVQLPRNERYLGDRFARERAGNFPSTLQRKNVRVVVVPPVDLNVPGVDVIVPADFSDLSD